MSTWKSAVRAWPLIPILIALALVPACKKEQTDPVEKPIEVSILFFNDLHGHLLPFTVDRDGEKVEVGVLIGAEIVD